MKFVNLTPRTVTILDDDGKAVMKLPASGVVAICTTRMKTLQDFFSPGGEKIQCVTYGYDNVVNLPAPCAETFYVVSYAVLQALDCSRKDVIAPDTSPGSVVRDPATQRVLGVKRFRKL